MSPTTGKPFWSGDAVKGFKYKDSKGENGPVKVVQIKKSTSGSFTIKVVVDGKLGTVSVVPPNLGTGACALLEIGGGDSYSVRFADGVNDNKAATQFKVTKPATAGSCVPCDFLDTSDCLFPFPSDYLTTTDASTDTGTPRAASRSPACRRTPRRASRSSRATTIGTTASAPARASCCTSPTSTSP